MPSDKGQTYTGACHCGSVRFEVTKEGVDMRLVNLRRLDGVDVNALNVTRIDGRSW
ncbi:MAG TPA: hypothetical protein VEY30_03110 [Myxococcaceae bacterium]|nr:hypothetical protein [Myxococcaceae bacterium]